MECPHCDEEIDDVLIAKHLAAKGGKLGGKKSRRIITPEQQAKMQAARKNGKLCQQAEAPHSREL